MLDEFIHKTLKRPYTLAKTIDSGEGTTVILLHGIGRTGKVWHNLIECAHGISLHLVAYDLLGFGESPKPDWVRYSTDDHARAVIASIEKLHLSEKVVIVGHSMGCLVAVRVATLRPDLVRHLVLFEMPLYDGLPEKRRYRYQLEFYARFFKRIMDYQPTFDKKNARMAEKFARRVAGFEVDEKSWNPLVKSLENTIIAQNTAAEIKHLDTPMDVIFGMFDMLVIRGQAEHFFGEQQEKIQTHKVRARHSVSVKASQLIVDRINAALATEAQSVV